MELRKLCIQLDIGYTQGFINRIDRRTHIGIRLEFTLRADNKLHRQIAKADRISPGCQADIHPLHINPQGLPRRRQHRLRYRHIGRQFIGLQCAFLSVNAQRCLAGKGTDILHRDR